MRAIRPDLLEVQAAELVVSDPPGEGLGALLQQLGRGTSQDQKTCRRSTTIRQHPQHREDLGAQLDLVENDQAPQSFQGEQRIVQPVQVARVLQVEACHLAGESGGKGTGEGRLPHLAGTDQAHDGELLHEPAKPRQVRPSLDHRGCYSTMKYRSDAPNIQGFLEAIPHGTFRRARQGAVPSRWPLLAAYCASKTMGWSCWPCRTRRMIGPTVRIEWTLGKSGLRRRMVAWPAVTALALGCWCLPARALGEAP